jgi:Transposase DDE domain group 1
MDRYRPWLSSAERCRARYGFEREPDARRTGEQRLERSLCLRLLPSVVRVQSVRHLERCALRPGNVHSADGWESVLRPVIERYKGKVSRIYFRADDAFANPEVYEFLEAERIKYAIRLPANRVLQERIGYLLTRPIGRPPSEVRRSYANFTYQAASWTKPRRVVAKVE